MSLENSLEKKSYLEKNLEAIKIINDEVIDIINGQGCLIGLGATTLFGSDDSGHKVKIKEFEKPYKVTSHGYLYCAEVIGLLSDGRKFYIHANDSLAMQKIINAIMEESRKITSEEDLKITEIRVKSDFERYGEDKDVTEDKKREFERRLKDLGLEQEAINIENESFVGFTPEKVVGYDSEEGREKF